MKDPGEKLQRTLNPLWYLALGLLIGLLLCIHAASLIPGRISVLFLFTGMLAFTALGFLPKRSIPLLLFGVGLLLGIGRGSRVASELQSRRAFIEDPGASLRITGRILEGWTATNWGYRSRLRVNEAKHLEDKVNLPRSCRVEIRGTHREELPPPGQEIESLARLRASPERPLLLIASAGMVHRLGPPKGFPALREKLAKSLLEAAGHKISRIRAAELASALALGRRDLMPPERLESWRRGGAAHVLAVSGLHIGIISGLLWIIGILLHLHPNTRRILIIPLISGYALLAGASPSAMRACLMISLYLVSRLIGRAVLPMATILLAVIVLLLWNPLLLFQPGFQLTILITAALIRWLPPIIEALPIPKYLGALLTLPFLAQAAALPLVATHFRALNPATGLVNLAVPFLLSPTIPLSAAATLVAGIAPGLSAHLLDLISLLSSAFSAVSALGWSRLYIPPAPSVLLLVPMLIAAILAFRYDRAGRIAGPATLFLILLLPLSWLLRPGPRPDSVDLLPVSDGTALLLNSADSHILFDGGRFRSDAAEKLADAGIRSLDALILSHADGDHIGGVARILETVPTKEFILPRWLMDDPRIPGLLSRARNRGTRITPIVRGLDFQVGDLRLRTLWPPYHAVSDGDNDRSLVIRARWTAGSILLTGDISRSVDFQLLRRGNIRSDLLLVPHHGSRNSSSTALLDAVSPSIALIPAGPGNLHHHPHSEILRMLRRRHIPSRYPARDGVCGALFDGKRWRAFP